MVCIRISKDAHAMFDLRNPGLWGLTKPSYGANDPEVRAIVGGTTKVYKEIAAKRLRARKDGRLTRIDTPWLVDYAIAAQQQPLQLRPSPNPKAKKALSA
jgi:hypothetical protein